MIARRYPPQLGTIVIYRSRTGRYNCPAVVVATAETLDPRGVQLGNVPPISQPSHNVHLVVLTPGLPGKRDEAADFLVEPDHGRSENIAGTYQEFDIPFANGEPGPGTWRWTP